MKRTLSIGLFLLMLFSPLSLLANPLDAGINRMNSALQDNGVANPNVSIGIKFNIPIEHPTEWDYGFYMPRSSTQNLCNKPTDSSSFSYENRANPCSINASQNSSASPLASK